jgi:Ni/Fe-hydrogenase subunit HybB-like protein
VSLSDRSRFASLSLLLGTFLQVFYAYCFCSNRRLNDSMSAALDRSLHEDYWIVLCAYVSVILFCRHLCFGICRMWQSEHFCEIPTYT